MDSKKETRKLSDIVGRAIATTAVLIMTVSIAFTVTVVIKKELSDAEDLLVQSVEDIRYELDDEQQDYLIDCSAFMKNVIDPMLKDPSVTPDQITAYLRENVDSNRFSEIDIVDHEGIIRYSSDPANVGYDMASDEATAAFLSLLDNVKKKSCEDVPSPKDRSQSMMYGAVELNDHNGFIMTGFDQKTMRDISVKQLMDIVQHRHVGETGSFLVCGGDLSVCASTDDMYNGISLADMTAIGGRKIRDIDPIPFTITTWEGKYDLAYSISEYGYNILALYPVEEAFRGFGSSMIVLLTLEVVLFLVVFIIVYIFLKRRVITGVVSLNSSLQAIAEGDVSKKADVRTSLEFESLSDNINITVMRIREMAENEARMLEEELSYARTIQHEALPGIFPAFPDRRDFGIYASMNAAEEVGGDFYDFYLISPNELIFLIADVSGKGIPAALFMMSAKSVIKSFAETGLSMAEVFTRANHELSDRGERVDMFVTAWMGVLDLTTGNLRYANAGHNPPLLIHEGNVVYLDQEPEMVLCAFDGYEYKQRELTLYPGDRILLYTDGVTESKNRQRRNYGEERLHNLLQGMLSDKDTDIKDVCKTTCEAVLNAVSEYAEGEKQSDDITLLCVAYAGECEEEK